VVEFLDDSLGAEGRARSVVVVSTSDESPLMRMRAALAATTVAEFFAAEGKHVLLVLDSLTRFAMAAREIGLAAGEPPTSKGYTPSVFTRLAKLVERTGQFRVGSITAFYTVLMEGDDQQDPLVDAVRSLLDGHIVLSRALAAEGWYPPIEVLDSISRLMPAVTQPEHREQAALLRRLMAIYARSEDLVRIGAYKPGADPDLDRALRARDAMRAFVTQESHEQVRFADSLSRLAAVAAEFSTWPFRVLCAGCCVFGNWRRNRAGSRLSPRWPMFTGFKMHRLRISSANAAGDAWCMPARGAGSFQIGWPALRKRAPRTALPGFWLRALERQSRE